jgi:PAS domain S-box-containing protein
VQWVNPAYTVLTGYTAGEVVGRELNCLKPSTCDGRLYVHLWNTILSGAVWQGEMTGQRKDGTRYSEEITITPVRSDNGEISHFIAIKVDITQRKQAEVELRATANRLQAILEHAPVGIVSGTREYRFVETNAAFQRMTGYSGEELKQMDWKALTHPDDIAHNADLSDRLMQGKLKNYDLEKRYALKDGRVIWVRSISAQLDDEHKISIIEDITERKEAVDKLRRSEIRLHRLIDSNIIGVVIHREDGSIIDANDAFLSMTSYTREDLANGLRWPNLTPPEYKPMHDRAIAELRQTGSFRPYEKEYLRKDGSRIPVLVGGVSTVADEAIIFIFDLTERKKAQAELARLARIVETTDEAILSISLDGRILSWNRGAEQLYGYSASEIIGQDVKMLIPEERKSEYDQHIRKTIESGQSLEDYETVRVTKSGEQKAVSLTVSPMRDESGQIASMSSFIRDLTQAKKAQQLEEQFRQAQKLEAVGRLTGGVAHDFNNLLMVISSYTETLEAELAPDDRLRKNTQQVLKATRRAASLTQQLLAFSRKQVLSPEALDLNTVVGDTAKMLKRLIGEDIELRFLPTDPPWPVMADPGQVTQVLMNLGINARDAMPKGGRLTIETHNAVVDAQTASRHRGFSPGHYTMIAISDTGTGMTKEVQDRIFEPFFTTKEKGKGTGLGLSTVYGIVKQSGGYIWVYSEVGKGSCFKLYFPRIEKPAATAAPLQPSSSEVRGETILLVEDEASVRESVGEYLRECGYEVLEASNGQQALEVMDGHAGPTHLLLTDVIMPKMSGPELARKLASRNGLVTLYMSGYTDDTIVNHGVLEPGSFIQKPFSLSALAEKVRNILDSVSRKGQEQDPAGLGQIGQENASRATPPEPRVSSMLD